MKKYILLYTGILLISFSCEKSNDSSSTSSLNIIQAVSDLPSAFVYFTSTPTAFYLQQSPVYQSSAKEFGISAGTVALTIVSSADTTVPVFQATLTTKPGGIYSLFLAGQTKAIDTVYTQDQIPYYSDSSAGIRFINLSPGIQPISVNLAGNAGTETEFANLGYKNISAFKTYSADGSVGGVYNFEIRDQSSDSLLATYSWYYSLKKNNTIVISGTESSGLILFAVNNY